MAAYNSQMYIKRDISNVILNSPARIKVLLGPRQCGKSTLFAALYNQEVTYEITFDDLQLRQLANKDPALFLNQYSPPVILDEIQYVPALFPELKRIVDNVKREITFRDQENNINAYYYLTGSNQILMDKNIKESLVGRASYFYLNSLSVHEILTALPETSINELIFKGGLPELYASQSISTTQYLNDYIRTFVEKDILASAGIQKLSEFHTVLGLLSARTGQLVDYVNIANDSGVSSVTVKEWISVLERADLIYILKPYFNNQNKRLIKTPKIYFLDTGLTARLQGWSESIPLSNSPQAGGLFETLVIAEFVKFIRNTQKNWELYFWRTKEGEEIDLLVRTSHQTFHAFEIKRAIQGITAPIPYPKSYIKQFNPKTPLTVVTYGGNQIKLSDDCQTVPITKLYDYLLQLS